jgi:hypothetical protein
MARPRKEIDEAQLKGLCRLKPTLRDCAAFFECSEDTIERRVKELGYESFEAFRDQNMVHTRFSLVRKAIQKAEGGDNTMLIFSLKNLCGWSDKIETINPKDAPTEELLSEIERLTKKVREGQS